MSEQNDILDRETVIEIFIKEFQAAHFRTVHDTGSNPFALNLWNMVRSKAGLASIDYTDLRAWCIDCKKYHVRPHSRIPSKYDSQEVIAAFKREGIYD